MRDALPFFDSFDAGMVQIFVGYLLWRAGSDLALHRVWPAILFFGGATSAVYGACRIIVRAAGWFS